MWRDLQQDARSDMVQLVSALEEDIEDTLLTEDEQQSPVSRELPNCRMRCPLNSYLL